MSVHASQHMVQCDVSNLANSSPKTLYIASSDLLHSRMKITVYSCLDGPELLFLPLNVGALVGISHGRRNAME
jgi:hypothetical protein